MLQTDIWFYKILNITSVILKFKIYVHDIFNPCTLHLNQQISCFCFKLKGTVCKKTKKRSFHKPSPKFRANTSDT